MALSLCNSILEQMKKDKYSETSIIFYSSVYKALKDYLSDRNLTEYSDNIRDKFLLDVYTIRISDFRYLSKHKQKRIRAMLLISIYENTNKIPVVLNYKDNKRQEMQSEFILILNKYIIWMEKEDLAPATRYQRKKRSELFLEYLTSKGIYSLNGINAEILYEFVRSFEGFSNRTTCLYILILNDFLKHFFLDGYISKDFSCLISTPMKRDERLPSIWKQDEIKAYIEAIDRSTTIGKRDYALSLLAIRLGLRGSDIRNLKLGDFDWMNHCININQIKTTEPLSLPLTDEIGWAIIDYIKNARPNTELKNLFVKATPPFTPYEKYGFQSMIDKYCHAAGINLKDRKKGLHSFRHSLATLLMNNQIPVQVIRSVLGHKCHDSVNEYLKVNTELLRECSLALEVIYG